jgi:CheY-like chemotaxis protein
MNQPTRRGENGDGMVVSAISKGVSHGMGRGAPSRQGDIGKSRKVLGKPRSASVAEPGIRAAQRWYNYDLVLVDWNVPNMLGIDAARAIRVLVRKMLIIMVTTEAGARPELLGQLQGGRACTPWE